ncbi:GIP [Symbiodinium natans]|uniref:GIP protein n=1 Tax=Symbiodinium natans TaxID=878477 RepID=A0A812III7_9DINO|nr:GIP [Symbiodinium natans]
MATLGSQPERCRGVRAPSASRVLRAHHGRPLKAVGALAALCGLLLSHVHGSFAAFVPVFPRQRGARVRLLAAESELSSKKADLVERLKAEAKAAKEARSKGFATNTQSLERLIESFDSENLGPVEAAEKLLTTEDLEYNDAVLKKLQKAMGRSLQRGDHDSLHLTVEKLLQWPGLEPTQEEAEANKNAQSLPLFFTMFTAVRAYCNDNADFLDMIQIGTTLEALMKLARKMWAADERINNAMTLILNKELYEKGRDPIDGPADIIGTLGLRETFQVMAYAALDMPKEEMKHVDAVSSMAWALATASVPLASLQIKVAKGILANIDKVMPPDIGKLFVAMHEMEWFKDKDSIAYLTQALVSRVQTLKQEDAGLAKALAARVSEAEAEAKAEAEQATDGV